MRLDELVGPDRIVGALRASDKGQLLRQLSERAGRALMLDAELILGALQTREALGSTGVGQGIALPHAKIGGLDRLFGLFARLERPIDFASIDGQPVDLVFLLLVPDAPRNEGLTALAAVARQLRDPAVTAQLRAGAADRDELYQALVTPSPAATAPGSS
jgi:PTS system nitrogen regulatory IIA component